VAYIKQVINADFLNTSKGLILVSSFLVIILITCKDSVKAIVTYWTTRFGAGIEAYFGEILLDGFLTLPYQWHLTRNSADLVTAVNWRIYLGRNFFEPCLKILNNVGFSYQDNDKEVIHDLSFEIEKGGKDGPGKIQRAWKDFFFYQPKLWTGVSLNNNNIVVDAIDDNAGRFNKGH